MNEKEEILQYAAELLRDKACISAGEIFIGSDADYARLLSLMANYRADGSPYKITLLEGHVKVNGYTLPNIVLSRRDTLCQRS